MKEIRDTILIVDDETDLLHGLKRLITIELGCRVLLAQSGLEALSTLRREPVDVVLVDIRMPQMNGIELLKAVKELDSSITVIVMTAYGTIERAVEAIKAGAYDFVQKPFDEAQLLHLLRRGLEFNRLVRENTRLLRELCEKEPFRNLVGQSTPMLKVFETIQMLSKTEVTVLIIGETGTGKDLAAQAIHSGSRRGKRPMVTVNCPALPESILESELFGYKKGAFTHAVGDKRGLFDEADGSTIFLDEIGDLSSRVQTKLLRVLEDKVITPLGSTTGHKVDVRIIAATNQDLEKKIREREFREDLYYRLNVATLRMPALREIREDIPLLVNHFLEKVACEAGTEPKKVAPEVMNYLLEKEWPGNIRELENTIRRWHTMVPEAVIELRHIAKYENGTSIDLPGLDFNRPYKQLKAKAVEAFTVRYLSQLLNHTKGNVSLAARISGIKRQSLQKIIKRYRVSVEHFRG